MTVEFGGRGGSAGRGSKRTHKGQRRHFTDEDDMKNQSEKVEREKQWRKQRGMDSDEEGEGESKPGRDESGSGSETDSDDDKHKGVEHLIEVSNPNRQGARQLKKVTEMDGSGAANLSRREREEIEKQQAKVRYQQLHMQGKTDEAQADLARLALIRKQREENAKKKEEERKAKEKEIAEKNARKGKS